MRALLLGELEQYSRYLKAVMKHCGMEYLYLPPGKLGEMPSKLEELLGFDVVVLSDAPSEELGPQRMELLRQYVERGKGLGMIGGWWSFTGTRGNYRGTPVEEALPVRCFPRDDRVNDPNGFKIVKQKDHPILEGLPWGDPPTVCGFNQVEPKPEAEVLLTLRRIESVGEDRVEQVKLAEAEHPLLVVGRRGEGRTLAFTTDLSPHWVGGMVDWGRERIEVEGAELGDLYLKFGGQLLRWLAGRA